MPNPFNPPSTITTYPFNVSLMAENTVLAYISSSYYNTGLLDPATQFYTGVGNSDIEGPAIVVACNHAAEAVFQSSVFAATLARYSTTGCIARVADSFE